VLEYAYSYLHACTLVCAAALLRVAVAYTEGNQHNIHAACMLIAAAYAEVLLHAFMFHADCRAGHHHHVNHPSYSMTASIVPAQVVEEGYEFFAKRQLVTIFSAPNYCGEFENAGAMMSVDETLMCSFQVRGCGQQGGVPDAWYFFSKQLAGQPDERGRDVHVYVSNVCGAACDTSSSESAEKHAATPYPCMQGSTRGGWARGQYGRCWCYVT
jgi:hypothetical protein